MDFEWKVEDMALMNEKSNIYIGKEKIYKAESELTRQEKIDFLDDMNDGLTSYVLNLADKYEKDKDSLPKDNYGQVKTVSFKAWLYKNDKVNLINNDTYNRGVTVVPPYRHIGQLNVGGYTSSTKPIYSDYVDEAFHLKLKDLEKQERQYFGEHDEYQILKAKVFEYSDKYGTFGLNIWKTCDGLLVFYKNDDANYPGRQLTPDELKLLNSKYEEIESLYAKITKELPRIDYDHEYMALNENIKIPDAVIDSFLNKNTVIRIDSKEQADFLADELRRRNLQGLIPEHYEYNPKYPYFYIKDDYVDADESFYNIYVDAGSKSCVKFSDIIERD